MHTGSYVNGTWYHPSGEVTRNINPADTSDVISEFPLATAADVRHAPSRPPPRRGAAWKKTPGPERGRVLWRAAEIARRRSDEIARTLTREEGKVLKEAKGEVTKGISLLEYYAGEGFRMHGKTLPSEARDCFAYTLRQPIGVVGLIAPWNFPWAIPVWKSAPALVAGQLRGVQAVGARAGHRLRCSPRSTKKPACRRACSTWSWATAPTWARRWCTRPSCAPSRSPGRTAWAAIST